MTETSGTPPGPPGWIGTRAAHSIGNTSAIESALAVTRIRTPEARPQADAPRHLVREVTEGLRFVLGNPLLRPMILTDGLLSMFLVTYQSMLLVFLARHIGLGSLGIGLVLSVMACGGLLGALTAGQAVSRIGSGPIVWLAPLCTAPAAALLPSARPGWPLYLAVGGLMLVSMGGAIRLVSQAGLQQAITPDRLLGQMSATFRFVMWGSMPLAGLLSGTLGELFGAPAVLWIGTAGMTLAFLPARLSPLRTTRALPTATPEPA